MELTSSTPPDRRIFCNSCRLYTNHRCFAVILPSVLPPPGYEPSDGPEEFVLWRMWACLGCETAVFEGCYSLISFDDEGDPWPDIEDSIYESILIPERTVFQVKAKQFNLLPDRLTNIYREILHAYNNDLNILCAIGIRTLIEGICEDQEITGYNLQAKIEGLSKLLPQNIVTNLHSLRFMGNEAAHELQASDRSDLHLAIEICEDLLNIIYELDYRAAQLARSRRNKRVNDDVPNLSNDDEQS